MIIVSQDRKKLIILERLTEVVVSDNEIVITDDIYEEYGETIGEYATEERAQEILIKIANASENEILGKVFYMPKE